MLERFSESPEALPPITPGEVLLATPNFHVVTDYKPGLEGQRAGERFFIEPKTFRGLLILFEAAKAHNIYNFTHRSIADFDGRHRETIPCLRADYSGENIPALFLGVTEIPRVGEDTIPSPQRMETCLAQLDSRAPVDYTFADGLPRDLGMQNHHTRQLKIMKAKAKDEIPDRILRSDDRDSYYKVRKGWWMGIIASMEVGIEDGEFIDPDVVQEITDFIQTYQNETFFTKGHITSSEDITEANRVIDLIWNRYGNMPTAS